MHRLPKPRPGTPHGVCVRASTPSVASLHVEVDCLIGSVIGAAVGRAAGHWRCLMLSVLMVEVLELAQGM